MFEEAGMGERAWARLHWLEDLVADYHPCCAEKVWPVHGRCLVHQTGGTWKSRSLCDQWEFAEKHQTVSYQVGQQQCVHRVHTERLFAEDSRHEAETWVQTYASLKHASGGPGWLHYARRDTVNFHGCFHRNRPIVPRRLHRKRQRPFPVSDSSEKEIASDCGSWCLFNRVVKIHYNCRKSHEVSDEGFQERRKRTCEVFRWVTWHCCRSTGVTLSYGVDSFSRGFLDGRLGAGQNSKSASI